jgi:protein phosphatase
MSYERTVGVNLEIPELSLVLLIGPSGSGKSAFAAKHFRPTEVLSSDACRAWVSDDETDQASTPDAFDVLHYIAAKRLARGNLTVIDATNVQRDDRKPLLALAREYHALAVAIVFDLPVRLCHERNRDRPNRDFGAHVVRNQANALRRSLRGMAREGFRHVYVLKSPEEVEAPTIERVRMWTDRRGETGPFDVIGDVHGCIDELLALLEKLGYEVTLVTKPTGEPGYAVRTPEGRKVVFVGDLVDRGPDTPSVLRLAMDMVAAGTALCVPGNHDVKLMRKLRGRDVRITHGLAESLEQLGREGSEFREQVAGFLDGLISHYLLDGGRLVVAHAGMKGEMQGRASRAVRAFALYGDTTGETDEFGLPVRYQWARDYRGGATVVYGHTPVPEPEWLNGTINIDTGCVFGGRLTALRYPELEIVSVPAARVYAEPIRPFRVETLVVGDTARHAVDDVLDIDEVLGKRIVRTRLRGNITIREENAAAALEVMSRFAADPRWLIYLPPTMSPAETTQVPGLLEHPAEAFAYYRHEGVARVVCEEKHMGSRAVVVLCRDEESARRRFGVEQGIGILYTRTGRRFFADTALESELLTRLQAAVTESRVWEELATDWLCLDAELLPWSAKAEDLLKTQYAAIGSAGCASLDEVNLALHAAQERGLDVGAWLDRYRERRLMLDRFVEAYREYCWEVESLSDLKLAPFHLLATEGAAHCARDHLWHLETLARICGADEGILLATPYQLVDVTDPQSGEAAAGWWEERTAQGAEGMVVKPLEFIARGPKGIAQPGVKVRGREYLRIIYGPEYTEEENLKRLRSRGLGRKRSLALREFALGVEGLERFVRLEPLRRVHECVFGVLALESEPVDPRL